MPALELSHLGPLHVDAVEIECRGGEVHFRGQMTSRQPKLAIQPFLKQVHDEAIRLGAESLELDVTELSFVNSSAIRLFVDWVMWAKGTADAPHYRLVFKTKDGITWQRMTLTALTALGPDVVRIVSS